MAAASLSEEVHAAVRQALRRLPAEHVRILEWRVRDNLDREAIVRLEGLTSMKQYEVRRSRAVKALGRELARLELGIGCRRARAILRRHPGAMLDPAHGAVGVHVETRAACRAFRSSVRGALAAMPLSPGALGAKLMLGTALA